MSDFKPVKETVNGVEKVKMVKAKKTQTQQKTENAEGK